ncbi:MAG: four helix bundle protein [Salibacteraceae bacterium]
MKQYSFEKLDVWKLAKDFTIKIYKVTQHFPEIEKFGLVSQLRRAAVSVSSNISEGSSRKGKKDQANFYVYAYSSSIEIINQLIISKELGFIDDETYTELRSDLELITTKLNRLHKSRTQHSNE